MHREKVPGEASFQLGPTRVVIERSKLSKRHVLTRCSPGMELSQCSGTLGELLAECHRMAPCVLVVSQESLEELDTNEFSAFVGVGGSVRVLVLGTRKSPHLVEKFLSMGCMGYLPQDVARPTLRRAVRAIASGQVWADRTTITQVMKRMLLKQLLQELTSTQVMKRMLLKQLLQELTSREKDIVRLIASGLSNRAIADRLYITHETVRWHIRALYSKLGVQDRFSAIVYGKRLLDLESGALPSEIPSIPKAQSSAEAPQEGVSPKAALEKTEWKSLLIS